VTQEALERFEQVAHRDVVLCRRDDEPPREMLNDERHGVHAGLCSRVVEDLCGGTERGCLHVGGERMWG